MSKLHVCSVFSLYVTFWLNSSYIVETGILNLVKFWEEKIVFFYPKLRSV